MVYYETKHVLMMYKGTSCGTIMSQFCFTLLCFYVSPTKRRNFTSGNKFKKGLGRSSIRVYGGYDINVQLVVNLMSRLLNTQPHRPFMHFLKTRDTESYILQQKVVPQVQLQKHWILHFPLCSMTAFFSNVLQIIENTQYI